MSPYYIQGQSNRPNARLVILNESDWSVEVDEQPLPNYEIEFSRYSVEVTDSKKLVFIRESDGSITAFGNLEPILIVPEPEDNFEDYTTDFYWGPDYGTYSAGSWIAEAAGPGEYRVDLGAEFGTDGGDWTSNLIPGKIRVTYTGGTGSMTGSLYPQLGDGWYAENVVSTTEYTIVDWYIADPIQMISFVDSATFTITKIEFEAGTGIPGPCQAKASALLASQNPWAQAEGNWTDTQDLRVVGGYYGALEWDSLNGYGESTVPVFVTNEFDESAVIEVWIYDSSNTQVDYYNSGGGEVSNQYMLLPATAPFTMVIKNGGTGDCDAFSLRIADPT